MMMQNPDDNLFKNLLSDYAAPLEDDGFTQAVMRSANISARHVDNFRRAMIGGACFIGGVIAATQLPALMGLIGKVDVALPAASTDLLISQWALAGIVLLGFVLWAALDRKASDLF